MVRRDRLDFGLWPGIPTDRLIIPTDTHIHLVARRLQLTRRRTADGTAARQITRRLARFDAADPVRFDYALCRIGIFGICRTDAAQQSRCHAVPGAGSVSRRAGGGSNPEHRSCFRRSPSTLALTPHDSMIQ